MKLESVKKHEHSISHKDAASTHHAQVRPECTPLELAVQSMEKKELKHMRVLFNTVFNLVARERPFHDFTSLLSLQS